MLAYLKKEKGHERVRAILSSGDVIMNDINIGETFYILARERGLESAEYFMKMILPSLAVRMVSNSLDEVIEAARLKSRVAMSYADCFAAATAIREQATIITGDPEFRLVEKSVDIEWM